MKNFDVFIGKVIYFIGIGGVSMCALSRLSHSLGCRVLGSDSRRSDNIDLLTSMGIRVYTSHSKDNITSDIDLVVYTQAVDSTHIEIKTALDMGIECIDRGEYLGMLSRYYDNTIAVSGTHGKTTTTAIISHILSVSDMSPTMHLGGVSVNTGDSIMCGDNIFVTEACEYKDSFRSVKSHISVVTNIEKEHMDYYPNMLSVMDSYNHFVDNSDILVCWVDKYTCRLRSKYLYTCGLTPDCDFFVTNIRPKKIGYIFDVYHLGKYLFRFENNVIGLHNVYNCLLAIATSYIYGVGLPYIYMGIISFKGVKRRFEYIRDYRGVPVIIDYAHHPTEISSSISGIKSVYKSVLCVFQPHTFSRTLTLMSEFKCCFKGVDTLAIFRTYKAREKSIIGGRAVDLYRECKVKDKVYINSKRALKEYLDTNNLSKYDVVLVLGAGDIADIVASF